MSDYNSLVDIIAESNKQWKLQNKINRELLAEFEVLTARVKQLEELLRGQSTQDGGDDDG